MALFYWISQDTHRNIIFAWTIQERSASLKHYARTSAHTYYMHVPDAQKSKSQNT